MFKQLHAFFHMAFFPLGIQVGFDSGHIKKRRKALCAITANNLTSNIRQLSKMSVFAQFHLCYCKYESFSQAKES